MYLHRISRTITKIHTPNMMAHSIQHKKQSSQFSQCNTSIYTISLTIRRCLREYKESSTDCKLGNLSAIDRLLVDGPQTYEGDNVTHHGAPPQSIQSHMIPKAYDSHAKQTPLHTRVRYTPPSPKISQTHTQSRHQLKYENTNITILPH